MNSFERALRFTAFCNVFSRPRHPFGPITAELLLTSPVMGDVGKSYREQWNKLVSDLSKGKGCDRKQARAIHGHDDDNDEEQEDQEEQKRTMMVVYGG